MRKQSTVGMVACFSLMVSGAVLADEAPPEARAKTDISALTTVQ
jgi:hypothetical protein